MEKRVERGLGCWQVSQKSHVFFCVSDVQKGVTVVDLVADVACYDARVMQLSPCCVNRNSLDKLLEAMKKSMHSVELSFVLRIVLHIGRFDARCNDRLASSSLLAATVTKLCMRQCAER
jgi:hypothetical protein